MSWLETSPLGGILLKTLIRNPKDPPKKNGGAVNASVGDIKGMTVFKNPQRFEECRICDLYVNEQSPPARLYENHHSDWVTGCPIFMALTTIERFRQSRKAEFCVQCFDKDVKFSQGSHMSRQGNQQVQCSVSKDTKHRYSCLDSNCLFHMWVCRKHKKLNEPTMKKQQLKLKKTGNKLSFTVSSTPSCSPPVSPSATQHEVSLPSYIPTALPESMMSFKSQHEKDMQAKEGSSRKSRNAKKKMSRNTSNFIPVPKGSPKRRSRRENQVCKVVL